MKQQPELTLEETVKEPHQPEPDKPMQHPMVKDLLDSIKKITDDYKFIHGIK